MEKPAEKTLIIEDAGLRSGFVQIPTCVMRDPKLSVNARWLYGELLSYAWQDGECFPGQDTISKDMGYSDRTVRTTLVELREKGLIDWQQAGLNKPNIYRLLDLQGRYPELERKPASGPERKPTSGLERKPASDYKDSGLQESFTEEAVDREILQALIDLPDWKVSNTDLQWLSELMAEYPNLTVGVIHRCRDWHLEHHPNKRRVWKTSLRNWLEKDKKLNSKAEDDPDKYTKGPYGHLVNRGLSSERA